MSQRGTIGIQDKGILMGQRDPIYGTIGILKGQRDPYGTLGIHTMLMTRPPLNRINFLLL